jgi:glycosyl transferase family 25
MFDSIEKVVYINLDERVDRKIHVQRELLKIFHASKIKRFAAIKREDHGGIGCTMSHIAVLEMAKAAGWKNVLVVEDDFTWVNFEKAAPVLESLLKKQADAIVFGGTYTECDNATYRLCSCQTTTAYLVYQDYYDTILANFKEGLELFETTQEYRTYALDQYWKRLHQTGIWYVVRPSIAAQCPGYSDIEKQIVNYTRYYN